MKNSKPPLALRAFHLVLWLSVLAAMAYLIAPSLLQRLPFSAVVSGERASLGWRKASTL